MATLYVENVPDELYEALRNRARKNRTSIAGAVIALLEQHVPSAAQIERRRRFYREAVKMAATKPSARGLLSSTEDMLLEDRGR